MGATEQAQPSPANAEAIEAWDGPLFDTFARYRHTLVNSLVPLGEEAMRVSPPAPGDRVLDLGCGFGDSTQQLAELAGPEGSAVGVDSSPRFIAAAREEAAGVENVSFEVVDVESGDLGEGFDMAFSRFGVMFFSNPVAALRNVRSALVPGGRLVAVVWRSKVENEFAWRAQEIVERFVTKPEESDQPTCGPGPFSMGNADTTSGQLVAAGFDEISLRRCDRRLLIGRDLGEAADLVMSIGPGGEIMRLAGESAAHLHEPVRAALMEEFAPWEGPEGVLAPASTWIVTATAPRG